MQIIRSGTVRQSGSGSLPVRRASPRAAGARGDARVVCQSHDLRRGLAAQTSPFGIMGNTDRAKLASDSTNMEVSNHPSTDFGRSGS
jgi:hypothetical protein